MKILLPAINPSELSRYENGVLSLCAPLTPTQNTWDRWHKYQRNELRNTAFPILRDQTRRALGARGDVVWSKGICLSIVRCSNAHIPADQHNVLGGCKGVIDLLQKPKVTHTKKGSRIFPGIGLVEDDKQIEILSAKDVTKKRWTLPGPGTWLFIWKQGDNVNGQLISSLMNFGKLLDEHKQAIVGLQKRQSESNEQIQKLAVHYLSSLESLEIARKHYLLILKDLENTQSQKQEGK